MRYFVFIDETGDASVIKPDPRFQIFVLCGVIFREDVYLQFDNELKALKRKYFSDEGVVFHSSEMRAPSGVFKILKGEILKEWYVDIGKILSETDYKIISCIVDKEAYRKKYPHKNHAYEDSLTFLCERALRLIGNKGKEGILHFCLEKRAERKDRELRKVYTRFIRYGTDYTSTTDVRVCNPLLYFRSKKENINGLQLADLCAYPIARKHLSPDIPQKTYEIIECKLYQSWYGKKKGYGLKYFP